MIRFAVTTLLAETSEYDLLVFHLSSDDHYLTIQRRADLKPGRFGDIRFECDGQMWSGYDVIRQLHYSPALLRIALDPAKATKFEGRHDYEIEFGIEFSQAEIRGFENVGALMAAIQKKLAT